MPSLKEKIREHYDFASPYYLKLWGRHIHHGLWRTGRESRKSAQERLIEELVLKAGLRRGMRVLDVGCGIGGAAVYLAKKPGCRVTGVTLSPVQAEMAGKFAREEGVEAEFLVLDAERPLRLGARFDAVVSIEAVSHFNSKAAFWSNCRRLLKPGGRVALVDWMKRDGLGPAEERKFIRPIEEGMLLPGLAALPQHLRLAEGHGFAVLTTEDFSAQAARTWDLASDLLKNPNLWKLALRHSLESLRFLKSFRAMRRGYASKTLLEALLVAEKR